MVRLKNRYLLVNILYPTPPKGPLQSKPTDSTSVLHLHRPSSDELTARFLQRLIQDSIKELFGDYGSGMVAGSLQVKYMSPATSTAIIRVARSHYRLVWAALSFISALPTPINQPCVIQVVRVSGTIRKAEEEAIRRARAMIIRLKSQDSGNADALAIKIGYAGPSGGVNQSAAGIEDPSDGEDEDEDMPD